MPKNFELISTVTVGSGGATWITFSSIPQTYTDLVILLSGRSGEGGPGASEIGLYFNGKSYPVSTAIWRRLMGDGSAATSQNGSNYIHGGFSTKTSATASTFCNNQIYIPNYAGSTAKTVSIDSVSEINATQNAMDIVAGIDTATAAITQIDLDTNSGWQQYTTASLYGILKGSGGATVS